ncbi:hypothetical protein Pmar_PMAR013124 [Perkinsus marinus ATCC 50983]|uniref:Phospholipid/glycerol acyltransferase domain-containing protein n=1 Tax=Perkinsus marinus (strain ATCC 50983 / TXsc) TaxID=423536 RepID=C5L4Z2_PERM5|nr:hypothetical protein Pmar_PMAR013124 [Perkinsus marinus ATCC 50983]EER08212.1 hypothetical protein Pmar_PMAR013124 [Perkinsus marinus ATCC 50983]|eukprot:XP_002776396.1 hypothetical protein Pmar_PMAR013124 [Perkinsus marinus ATCC 50983]
MSWPTILFLAVYLLTTALCVYAVARGYADAKKCSTERIIHSFGEVPSDWKAFIRPKSLRSNFVSIMILAVTVVPLKFIAVIFIHVVALIGLYTLPTRIFLKLLSYCCAALVKITGITVREEGTRLPANEVPTIVSNHVSYFDILIMLSRRVPVAFVAKKAVAKYPVSGDICTSLGSVYVSRAKDPKERERVMAAIGDKQTRVMEGRSRYQLCVFPEGTTSNGTSLMHYHDGAFHSMLPVQPLYIEYSNLNLSFTCLGIIPHAFLVLALPPWLSLTCTLHWLPKVTPDPNSSVGAYAEKTRHAVAAAGNLRLDDKASYRSHMELEKFFFGDSEKLVTRKIHDIAEGAKASRNHSKVPDMLSLRPTLRVPGLGRILQAASFSRVPASRVLQEAENRFRVSNDIDVRELGDSVWSFLHYPGDLLVMQGHGITPVSTVLKSIAHASRIRDRPIDVVVTGAPADSEGAFGGRSRELWIAAIKPEEEAAHNVLIPKEPIRVGAKTQPSSLAGFVSHRLKEEGVALLQGSSAVTIAKMADAIALAGAHFDGEEGRSLGHLVCRLRTIVVEADATATPEKEVVDHASEDGSDHGESTSSRPNRIRVMQILVRLKEGPVGGCLPAEAQTGGGSEEEGAEVTIDSIDKAEGDDDTVTRMLSVYARLFLPHCRTCRCSRGFRTLATKEMQQAEDRLRVTSSADPIDLAPFIRQRLGTPNRPNMVVLQALGANAVGRALRSVAYAASRKGQNIPLEVTLTGPPDDGIPDRGGGDLWIAVSRQGFRQRLRESQDSPTEIQDVIVGHSTPAHKMAGVITNALLQGKTVRMAGFSAAGIIKIANAITISSHHCETFDDVEERGRIVTSVRTSLRAVNARGTPSDHNDEQHHDESTEGDQHETTVSADASGDVIAEPNGDDAGHKVLITAVEFTCNLVKNNADS